MKLMIENRYDVAPDKWRNWSYICQRVFNETCTQMLENPSTYQHPDATAVVALHWDETCFNAAWTAADACQQATKAYLKNKKELT